MTNKSYPKNSEATYAPFIRKFCNHMCSTIKSSPIKIHNYSWRMGMYFEMSAVGHISSINIIIDSIKNIILVLIKLHNIIFILLCKYDIIWKHV